MGNTMSAIVSYLIASYIYLAEKARQMLYGELRQKNYFNNDILLKDDEQKADILSSEEINKMLEKQRILKKNQNNPMNEYKMIKNSPDPDDIEQSVTKQATELQNKELQEIHKEINIKFEEETDNTCTDHENIEDLKSAILNTKDEE